MDRKNLGNIETPKNGSEIDIPPDGYSLKPSTTLMPDKTARKAEKQAAKIKNADQPGFIKLNALNVFWAAGACLLFLYGLEVILKNNGYANGESFTALFETVKIVMTTMMGFLFGKQSDRN